MNPDSKILLFIIALVLVCFICFHENSIDDHGRSLEESNHKKLFPLNQNDYTGLFFIIIGLMIAAAGGIGGGGIIVPILIIVFEFEPKYAIPLSNFTILGCSIMNVSLNLSKRHPNVDRPLVDWDLIMVLLSCSIVIIIMIIIIH